MIDNIVKLRTVQLELIRAFVDVCEVHGLKYYAFFGTLLGIMRGEGYLPWDDDVDFVMPEEDYFMLCNNREWFDKQKYHLQTPVDNGALRYAKLRKNGTTAFCEGLTEELKKGGHHGISIDIIPLSELPGMDCYHTPCLMNIDKKEAVYPKSWFEPAAAGRFEDLILRIPARSRRVLTEVYEDWAWPHGVMESRPTLWFFDTETDYKKYVRRYTGMLEYIDGKKIFLFGAADSLRIFVERFERKDQIVCTFDNDPGKWGKKYYDVEVKDPAELPGLMDDNSRVIIVSLWHQEIGRQLEKMGINDYYVYLDDYFDEKIGNKVVRREDMDNGNKKIAFWKG